MPAPRKLHDEFFKKAKAEGYVARSAYKLKEIQERKRIVRRGDRVLDLGCAPGSWLQVASELVGGSGIVLGVDLQPVSPVVSGRGNVRTIVGDAFTLDPGALGEKPFDVVLSDMAPNTSGHGDDLLSTRLCRRVLELCSARLRPGGNLAMKVLEGAEFPALLKETRALFAEAGAFKPRSSRDVSREIFLVAKGFRAGA